MKMFQFQTGSIKRNWDFIYTAIYKKFQFQTGSIKSQKSFQSLFTSASFNSKLVRLKELRTEGNDYDLTMFQFQTGSIKSRRLGLMKVIADYSFNSKLVRLKVNRIDNSLCGFFCFNSKLVRLKAKNRTETLFSSVLFQFQTGSIKSLGCPCCDCFDCHVSIPNWFD